METVSVLFFKFTRNDPVIYSSFIVIVSHKGKHCYLYSFKYTKSIVTFFKRYFKMMDIIVRGNVQQKFKP